MTLMSIIQALALEFLWDLVRTAERAWTWSAVLVWLQIITTMLGILQVWLFYMSVAMRFRWVPRVRDLLLPFLIGVLEFTLIDLTGTTQMPLWFVTLTSVFAVAAWDAQNVFVTARKDLDNSEYFNNIPPAGMSDFVPLIAVELGLLLFAVALFFAGSAPVTGNVPWLALCGLVFASGILVHRIDLSRRFWNASMQQR